MHNDPSANSFRAALVLGYAGLLPQLAALIVVIQGGPWLGIAGMSGFIYPALIFSFLGGVWWGQALSAPNAPRWIYMAAVLASLLALALALMLLSGTILNGEALISLGVLVAGSPLVDRIINKGGPLWMRLRWHLSLGLGLLTVVLGVVS